MFVCVCNAVRDRQIVAAVHDGVRGIKGVCLATRAGTTCGKCLPEVKRQLTEAIDALASQPNREQAA